MRPRAALYALCVTATVLTGCTRTRLYVSPDGSNAFTGRRATVNNSGTDGPFATLPRALEEVAAWNRDSRYPSSGVEILLADGEHVIAEPIVLTTEHCGTAGNPLVIRSERHRAATLNGGRRIDNFSLITDADERGRLDESAQGYVVVADLAALGIIQLGQAVRYGERPELFYKSRPMTLARWPNEGYAHVGELKGDEPVTVHGKSGNKVGRFTYEGDRPARWKDAADVYLVGFWFWDWAEGVDRIESIDTDNQIIQLAQPYHGYGYQEGQRYFAENLLIELDAPGEWYLDRETSRVYFWPPEPIVDEAPILSVLPHLIVCDNVRYARIEKLTMAATRNTPVVIQEGADVTVAGCTIHNSGGMGVEVRSGQRHRIESCDIYNTGGGGILLSGGDRKTLAPGGHEAVNNHIHHYSRLKSTYGTGVVTQGVANRVAHNRIHDAPHMGILLGGNESIIELNEIFNVCTETDDAGAFYMGRDWTQRGNIIRHNYFHHIGGFKSWVGTQSIYLDDWTSDVTVYGNICYKGGRGVLVGGGRNNRIENNIFVECIPSIHIDSRGLGWAKNYFDGTTTTLTDRMEAVNYINPPYSERYPELLTLYEDEPALAKYNSVVRNISIGGKFLDLHDNLTIDVVKVEDNLVDQDPMFVDLEAEDFRLRDGSPAIELGFQQIPVGRIGLYADRYRDQATAE